MNFVIFSGGFLPTAGAENYCTTRFASALVHAGHSVQVVTIRGACDVSSKVCDQLVDPGLKITYLPVKKVFRPLLLRLWYRTFEWEAVNFRDWIRSVKGVLKSTENPVLITRANPLLALIVGWHCRKWAWKWIAHASDPIPIPGRDPKRSFHGYVNRFWMRRIFRDADAVSVTCPNAIRAFQDEYGEITTRVKFMVVPHIGEPALRGTTVSDSGNTSLCKHIVHHGVMCAGRGGPELAECIRRLNKEGTKCDFVQCGQVDDVQEVFDNDPQIRREMECETDVEYIPDLKVPLPYCPFLSSKIVYRIYDDKPILLYTNPNSMSAELARKYPEAGIFWADNTRTDSLDAALKLALSCDYNKIDRSNIRRRFSRSKIISDFIAALNNVCRGK